VCYAADVTRVHGLPTREHDGVVESERCTSARWETPVELDCSTSATAKDATRNDDVESGSVGRNAARSWQEFAVVWEITWDRAIDWGCPESTGSRVASIHTRVDVWTVRMFGSSSLLSSNRGDSQFSRREV
jgi:hypothetical protein